MWTRPVAIIVIGVAFMMVGSRTRAAVIDIVATVDGYANNAHTDLVFTSLSLKQLSIGASDTFSNGLVYHQRGMVEFALSSIPANARINAVSFVAVPSISSSSGSLVMDFSLYAGNGTIELADATASSSIDGVLTRNLPLNSNGQPISVAINPLAVQSLLGNSNYAGLILSIDHSSLPHDITLGFISLSNPNTQYMRPTLRVDYTVAVVPEPATLVLGAVALPVLGIFVWKRRKAAI